MNMNNLCIIVTSFPNSVSSVSRSARSFTTSQVNQRQLRNDGASFWINFVPICWIAFHETNIQNGVWPTWLQVQLSLGNSALVLASIKQLESLTRIANFFFRGSSNVHISISITVQIFAFKSNRNQLSLNQKQNLDWKLLYLLHPSCHGILIQKIINVLVVNLVIGNEDGVDGIRLDSIHFGIIWQPIGQVWIRNIANRINS